MLFLRLSFSFEAEVTLKRVWVRELEGRFIIGEERVLGLIGGSLVGRGVGDEGWMRVGWGLEEEWWEGGG